MISASGTKTSVVYELDGDRVLGNNPPAWMVLQAALEKHRPDLWKLCYPRIYENVSNYHSPKMVATAMASVILEAEELGNVNKMPIGYRLMYPALRSLIDRKFPLLFLSQNLLEAVRATEFREEIDWTEMKLPYESGVIVLPKGGFRHEKEGDVAFLFWSRLAKGFHPAPIPSLQRIENMHHCLSFTLVCPEKMVWYDGNFTEARRKTFKFDSFFYEEDGTYQSAPLETEKDQPLGEEDRQFLEQAGHLLFGTLLALTSRPDLLVPGHRLRTVKAKHASDQPKEFWEPTVIGKHYIAKQYRPAPLGGTHASPKMHWRRGAYRHQPYGPGSQFRKVIWIEPTLVAAYNEKRTDR